MIKTRTYRFLAIIALFVLGACGYGAREVDWFPYYEIGSKEPYGLYVFNAELDKIQPKFLRINRLKSGVYTAYESEFQKNSKKNALHKTYLYIDEDNKMNSQSRQRLLDLAYYGSHVFIATQNFEFDEFNNFDAFSFVGGSDVFSSDKDTLELTLEKKESRVKSDRFRGLSYFTISDTSWAYPLGYFQKNEESPAYCNFLALRYGDGIIYMHSNPEVFTNYFLLNANNHVYLESLLSYLKFGEIVWFVDYNYEFDEDYGLLTYILNQPGLRMAWYLCWILLIFVVFTYAKRTQRIIPIQIPKKNYSVDYTKRLAQFHLIQKNYHGLIDKQIVLFLDKLRVQHRLDTSTIDEDFAERMYLLSNCDKLAAQEFVNYIRKHRARSVAFDFDFEELRKIIKRLNL